MQKSANIVVFDVIKHRVGILIECHIILPEHLQEAFGLAFELGGTFGDPRDDLFVCELFEAIMDVTALLMRPHHALCPIEETLLNLD